MVRQSAADHVPDSYRTLMAWLLTYLFTYYNIAKQVRGVSGLCAYQAFNSVAINVFLICSVRKKLLIVRRVPVCACGCVVRPHTELTEQEDEELQWGSAANPRQQEQISRRTAVSVAFLVQLQV